MSDGLERILKGIKENSGNDEVIQELIEELIYFEYEYNSGWYKETYKKLIKEKSKKWGKRNED